MKKFIKWTFIIMAILVVITIVALIVIPSFVGIEKYRPLIEKEVAKAINRPFVIKGGLKLKLFPVAVLKFSDLHIGNPKGFKEKDFLYLKAFDVQVKLIPLIWSRDLQIKKFILKNPKLTLIREKDAKVNWEFDIFSKKEEKAKEFELKRKRTELKKGSKSEFSIPLKALSVDEFSLTNGEILWIDHMTGQKKGITGVNLKLKDISFTKPISVELAAKVEGKPIVIKGKIGPLGKKLAQGIIPLNLSINAFKQINASIKGNLKDLTSQIPKYDLDLKINPFSPRRLFSQFGGLPFKTQDSETFQKFTLSAHIKGTPQCVSISNGLLILDQSRIDFFLKAKEFKKPVIAFNIKLNSIDLDRYMPISKKKPKRLSLKIPKVAAKTSPEKKVTATDYTPLRKLKMDGKINIGKLIVKKVVFKNLYARLLANNGIIKVSPLKADIYQGKMLFNADVDIRGKIPVTKLALNVKDVLIGRMLKDMLRAEILTGIFNLDLSLKAKGDTAEAIILSLNGDGQLLIKDGYITGIDLKGMIHNIKAAFGFGKAQRLKRKTIFSEIRSSFRIRNGIFRIEKAYLISPYLRVSSRGNADLLKKTLNFRVNPEYIKSPESTIVVPVIISGTFSSPHFAPDLTGIVKEVIFKKLFKKEEKKEQKSLEEVGKELLRDIFGR